MNIKQIISIILVILLVLNLILFALGTISVAWFWLILGIAGLYVWMQKRV